MVSQEDLYSSLYRTWKIELSGQDLHKLPDPTCFLKNIQLIFMETKKKLDSENKLVGKLILQKILSNIQYLFNDLLDIRANKILLAVKEQKKIDETLLLDIEIEYYHTLTTAFRGFNRTKNAIVNLDPGSIQIPNSPVPKTESKTIGQPEREKDSPIEQSDSVVEDSQRIRTEYNNRPSEINLDNSISNDTSLTENSLTNESNLVRDQTSDAGFEATPNSTPEDLVSIQNSINAVKSSLALNPDKYSTIVIVKDQTAIVGEDFEIYGPFHAEDILFIPYRNADILIEEKVAKKLNETKI